MPESNYIRSKKIPERPACLRYSPIDDRETIATTYQLTEEKERIGSFFVLDAELNMKRNIRASGGIFRFNTFPHCPDKVFAVLTTGRVSILDLVTLDLVESHEISDGMLLSLDYCENRFLTTDEKGRVLVVDSNSLKELSRWKAHHLPCASDSSNCEVWSCAWLDSNVAASGADDSLLKLWDLRTGTTPTVVNKSHEGGVVFLEKRNECYFITGCYDENIRLFDTRIPNKPVKITKVSDIA